MPKNARERLQQKKTAKKVVLETDFAGIRAGRRMLVGTPQMIDSYIREIPVRETRSLRRLRRELARREGCDTTCPVSTAIFVRIAAEAALEDMGDGHRVTDVTPFWRLVSPNDKLANHLTVDPQWIARQRTLEWLGLPEVNQSSGRAP